MPTTTHRSKRSVSPLLTQTVKLAQAVTKYGRSKSRLQPRVFLVGGAVRDSILQIPPKDADLEIYGIPPAELGMLLHATYTQAKITAHAQYGTWEVRTPEGILNVSIPRTETYFGPGHTDVMVALNPYLSRTQALARRDFTINAILADPLSGTYYDPYHGRRDLEAHTLRAVDPNTFTHDALRAWRAIQLTARYTLKPDSTLKRLLKHMATQPAMRLLSSERIVAECDKLFAPHGLPSLGLELARTSGLLKTRITPLSDVAQKPLVWKKLKEDLDALAFQAASPAQCWQTILKALNETERLVLISELMLPKKYRLPAKRLYNQKRTG